jgi:HD-like signal output (HDOD) protein
MLSATSPAACSTYHFHKKSAGVRELVLLGLLTANHTHDLAIRTRYPRPEEAYLCGMFRNLGEVLIAEFRSAVYAMVLGARREHRLPEHSACLRVLNFTFEGLGRAVMQFWQMPKFAANCQTQLSTPLRRGSPERSRAAAGAHRAGPSIDGQPLPQRVLKPVSSG